MKMRKFLILTSLLALSSCGLFKKSDPVIVDRIVVKWDTVVTERIHIDTSFVTTKNDTVFITKDKIRVQIVRRFDTIRVAATYVGDTTAVEKVVLETKKSEPAKKGKGAKNTSASKSAKSKSDSGGSAKNHLAAQPKNLAAKK